MIYLLDLSSMSTYLYSNNNTANKFSDFCAQQITIPPMTSDYPSTYTNASIIGVSGTTEEVSGGTEVVSGTTEGVDVAEGTISRNTKIKKKL